MKKILAAAIGTGAIVLLGAVAPAHAAEAPATLSVLHGVPGLTVDVYVNDELTLDDFEPGDLGGPVELPAGTYTVAITASDAADASSPAIGPVDLPLESGKNYTAVAHLTAAGEPTATMFTNDISQTAPGQGRLTVRPGRRFPRCLAGRPPSRTAGWSRRPPPIGSRSPTSGSTCRCDRSASMSRAAWPCTTTRRSPPGTSGDRRRRVRPDPP